MPKMIFVNLPVADVERSTAFYEAIGFEKNAKFSNEQASSMMWSDSIVVMLLAKPFYATFTPKQIAASHATSGALYALSFDSRADVEAITEAAIAPGGRESHDPAAHGSRTSGGWGQGGTVRVKQG